MGREPEHRGRGWLVLLRRCGEYIRIGDALVHVGRIDSAGAQVRIAVLAPRDVPVHRGELEAADRDGLMTRTVGRAPGGAHHG